MIKKEIAYKDFNGQERKETFYFHFSKTEMLMLETSADGGTSERLQRIVDKKDGKEIMSFIHDFVLKAYGEKSDDGIYFNKSPEISKKFEAHPAFDILFMDLVMNPDEALNFVNSLLPNKLDIVEGTPND